MPLIIGAVMPELHSDLSQKIVFCHECAVEARERARCAIDPKIAQIFLELAMSWADRAQILNASIDGRCIKAPEP
jgi:hypothetical protein